jgi:predicted negative regulator of RcsB-dependent stress response
VKETLRAAAATKVLAGIVPRPLRMHYLLVAALLPALSSAVLVGEIGLEGVIVLLLASVAALVALLVVMRRDVGRHNAAFTAVLAGDLDGAERGFRALLGRPASDQLVAWSLYHLATVAVRRGDMDAAPPLLRASHEIERARFRRTTGTIASMIAADYALALAAAGKLDEAEAVLDDAQPSTYPGALALLARSRAYVALRRGKPEDAVAALDAERALIRNTLTANDDALAQAVEAVALSRTNGVYRNGPRAAHPVGVDAEARAYVMRHLPESAALLGEA